VTALLEICFVLIILGSITYCTGNTFIGESSIDYSIIADMASAIILALTLSLIVYFVWLFKDHMTTSVGIDYESKLDLTPIRCQSTDIIKKLNEKSCTFYSKNNDSSMKCNQAPNDSSFKTLKKKSISTISATVGNETADIKQINIEDETRTVETLKLKKAPIQKLLKKMPSFMNSKNNNENDKETNSGSNDTKLTPDNFKTINDEPVQPDIINNMTSTSTSSLVKNEDNQTDLTTNNNETINWKPKMKLRKILKNSLFNINPTNSTEVHPTTTTTTTTHEPEEEPKSILINNNNSPQIKEPSLDTETKTLESLNSQPNSATIAQDINNETATSTIKKKKKKVKAKVASSTTNEVEENTFLTQSTNSNNFVISKSPKIVKKKIKKKVQINSNEDDKTNANEPK
jgi:hypothetical protein